MISQKPGKKKGKTIKVKIKKTKKIKKKPREKEDDLPNLGNLNVSAD